MAIWDQREALHEAAKDNDRREKALRDLRDLDTAEAVALREAIKRQWPPDYSAP